MKSLDQLDKWIAGKVRGWTSRASGPAHSRELLEIRRDILEDVRDHIEPAGEGRSIFPFDSISIRVAGEDAERARYLEAAFGEDMDHEIRELLAEAGCTIPATLGITVAAIEDPVLAFSEHPFDVYYSRRGAAPAAAKPPTRPDAKLTLIRGEAEPRELAISSNRVNLGRMKEVMGDKDGLRRRNDVAFADTETTVSREHAYIRYDTETGRFRLYDSGSQRGTSIFREGRRLEVPRGAAHGVQLHSGDEINLGAARLRFEVAE
ncbi:MAG TPA: FHA domain-containing protein [Bryobacteraceae bacterium]|nr:FHA domain-containing protein [Bryobacteraceae bacterium]